MLQIVEVSIAFLFLVLMFAPLKLAYMALLLLAFFDASGRDFSSASSLGLLNASKTLLAPLVLLIRTKFLPVLFVTKSRNWTLMLFVLLTFYIAIASLWSSFPLSAIKMVGYFIGHLLWFVVLAYGINTNRLSYLHIVNLSFIGIIIGFIQTYVAGNPFGKDLYGLDYRFTAFSSPQSYAAFYGYLLILFLFSSGLRGIRAAVLVFVSFVAVIAAGSRYTFLMTLWSVFTWILYRLHSTQQLSLFLQRLISLFLATSGLGVLSIVILPPYLVNSRISEITKLISGTPGEIGTFAWRLGMYDEVLRQVQEFDNPTIVFGKGTSSGALAALNYDARYDPQTIDANRVIHNEFLRALYEWGMIGFTLLVIWVLLLISSAVLMCTKGRKEGYMLLSVLGQMVAGLFVENLLASSGSPVGMGLALALAWIWGGNQTYAPGFEASHLLPATRR